MKDRAALLLAGAIGSALAWAFWRYFGEDAFNVMSATVIIVLFADNARLRHQLRAKQDADKTS